MSGLEKALRRMALHLKGEGIPYMVIGGLANLVWGVPRSTLDADITVWVEPSKLKKTVARLADAFSVLPKDPLDFIADTRVLPLKAGEVRVDLVFAQLPYERKALRRAVLVELAGTKVRVCTPEDLIVHKVLSERPKDLEDLKGLARRMGGKLDRAYLDPIVKGLAADLARPDIWARFAALFPIAPDA